MSRPLTLHHQDTLEAHPDTRVPDPHQDVFSTTTFGFWVYLMTDCLLFATFFVTFAVFHDRTFGGPSPKDLFDLKTVFIETMVLLFSSVACGLALLSSLKLEKTKVIIWMAVAFLLGASFVAIELKEFTHLVHEGNSWERSAFLSSFFTLVGTHGLHVSVGLLWLMVMMFQVFWMGITALTFRRLSVFSMFWHFLDLIWIFIFTFVYLMGMV